MVENIGRDLRHRVSEFAYTLGYLGKVLKASFFFAVRNKASKKILTMQLLFTFVEALPICAVLAVAIGSSIFLLGDNFFTSLGQSKLTYNLLVMIVSRELGPLLIAFVVTARSATAIATELGSMVVSHEIEAYVSVGVDPIAHLVAPRFLGVTFSMFFLNIYFSLFGLVAPVLVVQLLSQTNMAEYMNNLFQALTMETVYVSIIKSIVFGMIISIMATMYGFNVQRASTEIPQAGIQAVGKAFFYIILADVLITAISYIFG